MAAGDGLVTMTPTSIVVAGAGSSASINSDGGVDFTAVTSLSLNGVFTGDYDNYLIVVNHQASADDVGYIRLRSSGTDATATNYTYERFLASSTSVVAARVTGETYMRCIDTATSYSGINVMMYGPALAQPTAYRSVGAFPYSGAYIYDFAGTHSLSTSYDGMTLGLPGSATGTVHVFGYEE